MDRAAFESEALSHLDAVYRHAMHLTNQAVDAEELTKEVFALALRPTSAVSFQPTGGGMRSWLLAICHHVFFLRRRPDHTGADATFHDRVAVEYMPDEGPPAWQRAMVKWGQVEPPLKRAIDALSPEHRESLLLWSVEGLKYREIAAILAVPIGTVMSRLHRARQILSAALQTEGFFQSLGPDTSQPSALPADVHQ